MMNKADQEANNIRLLLAAVVMHGIVVSKTDDGCTPQVVAKQCLDYADALLLEAAERA